jgi:hypothetical protein
MLFLVSYKTWALDVKFLWYVIWMLSKCRLPSFMLDLYKRVLLFLRGVVESMQSEQNVQCPNARKYHSGTLLTVVLLLTKCRQEILLTSKIIKQVACRPVDGQRSRYNHIYKSRCWVTIWQTNMIPRKRLSYNEERCFLCDRCPFNHISP